MIFFHCMHFLSVHALLVYECPEQLCIKTALSVIVLGKNRSLVFFVLKVLTPSSANKIKRIHIQNARN